MEALETVVGYWEDALNAYQSSQNSKQKLLTTSEEAEFTKMLENILESAYQLQVKYSTDLAWGNYSIRKKYSKNIQNLVPYLGSKQNKYFGLFCFCHNIAT